MSSPRSYLLKCSCKRWVNNGIEFQVLIIPDKPRQRLGIAIVCYNIEVDLRHGQQAKTTMQTRRTRMRYERLMDRVEGKDHANLAADKLVSGRV